MAVLLVANAPDGLVSVFADKQAAVLRDGYSDRATPDFAVGRDEAGHEVFVFAARFAGRFVERCAHDFVTSTFHAVPRTVECSEDVAFVFGRELITEIGG